MKKPEELHAFLQRVDSEIAKNRIEIRKARKRIARLNKDLKMMRQKLKSHKHEGNTQNDSPVLLLAKPYISLDDKRQDVLSSLQKWWDTKLKKERKARIRAQKEATEIAVEKMRRGTRIRR
jgi:hypothetical protein